MVACALVFGPGSDIVAFSDPAQKLTTTISRVLPVFTTWCTVWYNMAEETGWREGGEFRLAVVPADPLGLGRYAPFLSQAFYLQAMGDACLLIWGTREGFSSIPLQATALSPQIHMTLTSCTILAMLVASGTALLVPFSVAYWRYGYSLYQAVGLGLLSLGMAIVVPTVEPAATALLHLFSTLHHALFSDAPLGGLTTQWAAVRHTRPWWGKPWAAVLLLGMALIQAVELVIVLFLTAFSTLLVLLMALWMVTIEGAFIRYVIVRGTCGPSPPSPPSPPPTRTVSRGCLLMLRHTFDTCFGSSCPALEPWS